MSYMTELLEYDVDDLARRNGAPLLAVQLQMSIRDRMADFRQHDAEMRRLRSDLTKAQRVGLIVLRAHQQGRKTVRIADLIEKS